MVAVITKEQKKIQIITKQVDKNRYTNKRIIYEINS